MDLFTDPHKSKRAKHAAGKSSKVEENEKLEILMSQK